MQNNDQREPLALSEVLFLGAVFALCGAVAVFSPGLGLLLAILLSPAFTRIAIVSRAKYWPGTPPALNIALGLLLVLIAVGVGVTVAVFAIYLVLRDG